MVVRLIAGKLWDNSISGRKLYPDKESSCTPDTQCPVLVSISSTQSQINGFNQQSCIFYFCDQWNIRIKYPVTNRNDIIEKEVVTVINDTEQVENINSCDDG